MKASRHFTDSKLSSLVVSTTWDINRVQCLEAQFLMSNRPELEFYLYLFYFGSVYMSKVVSK